MNAVVEILNTAGRAFVEFSLPMLIQTCALILILLAVDIVLRRKVRAVFRYWIWMLVLVKLALPPSLGSPVSVGTWFGDTLEVPTASLLEPDPPQAVEPQTAELSPVISGTFSQPDPMIAQPLAAPPATRPTTPTQTAETRPPVETPAVSPSWQGLLLVIWVAVASALTLLLIQRAYFVRGLLGQSEEASRDMMRELEECRRRLNLRRQIHLRLSPNAASPAVCGLFRPVILIPQSIAPRLQSHDLQAVLLHELAHVKRGDLWVNLIQTLLQIAYFYNPLLWLANAMIRRTREQAVDETVLVAMGETARQYPEILVNIAKLAFTRRPALSLRMIGVVESKSALTARIQHILTRPLPKTAKLGVMGLLTLFVLAAVLLPMAKAQDETDGVFSRLAVLPNCGVWMSDINGQDLPVLDLASEKILVLPDVKKEYDLLNMTEAKGEGDILYYFDAAKGVAKITFLRRAGLGGEPLSNEHETVTITPMQIPFKTTVTTRDGGKFDIEIIRADEQACSIRFQPLNDSPPAFKAILSDGIVAEFLGVYKQPGRGETWWHPDGTGYLSDDPLEREHFDSLKGENFGLHPSHAEAVCAAAIRVYHGPDTETVNVSISPSRHETQASYDRRADGVIRDLCWTATDLPRNQKSCSVRCEIWTGPWEMTARASVESLGKLGAIIDGVRFGAPVDDPNRGVMITVSHGRPDRFSRVAALLSDGRIVYHHNARYENGPLIQETTADFPKVALADVEEFQFQTRPSMRIDFENVSLLPGRKTDLQIHARSSDARHTAPEVVTASPLRKIVLPEADKQPVVLDLATGELVPLPAAGPELQKTQQALRELGKGDILYDVDLGDRTLIFLRDAKSDPPGEETGEPFVTGHLIENLPKTITVVTKEGRRYEVTILAANERGCTLKYSRIPADRGVSGGGPVEPEKPQGTLEFRIAPRSIDLDAGLIETLKQMRTHGGDFPESDFAWFPIRTDLTGQPFAITRESDGQAYVLLWNQPPHVILASQAWGLESVYRTTDASGRAAIGLTFNDKGASLFDDLTAAHVQENLAIVVEGTVVAMPNISAPLGSRAIITGNFTEQEIEVLLAVLRKNVGRDSGRPAATATAR